MTVWNKRTGEPMDQEEVDLAREIWGKVTPVARARMEEKAKAASSPPPPVSPLPTGALSPKGRFGLPTF